MTFTLDTSGRVAGDVGGLAVWYEFEDLDAFTQGYVEALFAAFLAYDIGPNPHHFKKGFSDLSPEALAMILADCAAREGMVSAEAGGNFWDNRQAGLWTSADMACRDCPGHGGTREDCCELVPPTKPYAQFPPLTVSLGDDGKVHLTVQS